MQYLSPLIKANVGFESREKMIFRAELEVGVYQPHKGIPGKENTTCKGTWLIQGQSKL